MPGTSLPVTKSGPGGTGWSFGSHKGEVDSAGNSIWPGPGQASKVFSNGDSAGMGWAHDMRRNQARLPCERGSNLGYPAYHQVLDGTLSTDWFSDDAVVASQRHRLFAPATPQGWLHDEELPLPDLRTILEIERECRALPDHEMGPLGQRWLAQVYEWSKRMRTKYQGDRVQVAGSWR